MEGTYVTARVAALVLLGSLGLTADGVAQTCAARPSFNFARAQAGAGPAWSGSQQALGASVAYGSDRLFATLAGARRLGAADAADRHAVFTTIGASQPLRLDNRLHVCPMATVSYSTGASSRLGGAAEVHLGLLARNAAAFTVVPSAGVSLRRHGGSVSDLLMASDDAELVGTAAVGLVFRMRLAVTPRATLPFRRGAPVSLGVSLTMGLL